MCFQRWRLVELKCKQIIYINETKYASGPTDITQNNTFYFQFYNLSAPELEEGQMCTMIFVCYQRM